MTGASLPDPQIDIEVSLGVGSIYPGGVWDSATWDYNTWQQPDTSLGTWTDVTCYVINDDGLRLAAGSTSTDGVVTRWEAQTCSFTLIGDQWNPRGPYSGLLGPGLPVRVRWKLSSQDATHWVVCFTGYVDDTGFTYDPKTFRAQIAATDATRIFAAFNGIQQSPIGQGETAAQRVTRIADLMNWPAAQRDITAGGVAVQATALADAAWSMLLAVADTDLALLWISRAGNLAFRPEGKVKPSSTLSAIIGCNVVNPPVGVPVIEPINIEGQQPTVTRNIVSVSRQAIAGDTPVTVTVRDDESVSRYLGHTYERTDLIHMDDTWSTTVAQAVLMSSAWPTGAPEKVSLSSRADLAASALLLGLEPSLSIQVVDLLGNVWTCEPAGWDIMIKRDQIAGDITTLDVSVWLGSVWDGTHGWDTGKWGF